MPHLQRAILSGPGGSAPLVGVGHGKKKAQFPRLSLSCLNGGVSASKTRFRPGRYVAFQMAEVAIPRELFAEILRLIAELRSPPALVAT